MIKQVSRQFQLRITGKRPFAIDFIDQRFDFSQTGFDLAAQACQIGTRIFRIGRDGLRIDQDRIDRLVSSIQRQLETRGDEVTTSGIGEAVMDALKTIDHVAYIRFASVYKDFSEPGDFAEIAGAVGDGS